MATAKPTVTRQETSTLRVSSGVLIPYLVILLAHAPLVYVHLQQLWSRPHYQFFPLVLLASFLLIVSRARSMGEWDAVTLKSLLLSRGLLVASAGLLGLSFLRLSPLGAYASFLLTMASLILRLGIPAWGPWSLLLLLIRVPYGQDVALIQWMQRITTNLSSVALDTIHVEHIAEGNILTFPGRSLFVEEACSGVVSMLAIVACAGILAVWWNRSFLHGLTLIATGLFWAGAMNVVRVVTIAVALDRFGIDLTEGWRHETVGLFVFVVSLMALFSTDRLLLFLLAPVPMNPLSSYWPYAEENWLVSFWNLGTGRDTEEDVYDSYGDYAEDWSNPVYDEEVTAKSRIEDDHSVKPSRIRPRPWEWAFAIPFLLVGGAEVFAGIGPFSVAPPVSQSALDLVATDLPENLAGWKQVDFEVQHRDGSSVFGEHSRLWTYRNGPYLVRLSIDFVFPEWHELTACYSGTGWRINGRTQSDPESTRVSATLTKPNGEQAFLLFDLFESDGSDYVSPSGSFMHPQLRRIFGGEATRFTLPTYYQVQALTGIPGESLTDDARQSISNLFTEFRDQIRHRVTGQDPGNDSLQRGGNDDVSELTGIPSEAGTDPSAQYE
ncbi:MAG: exosortase U [Planctomycetaceae bacterium]